MTKDDVIRLAREAGFVEYELDDGTIDSFDKRYATFAKLIAEHEREACAKTVEAIETYEKIEKACFKFAAKTIRARGQA